MNDYVSLLITIVDDITFSLSSYALRLDINSVSSDVIEYPLEPKNRKILMDILNENSSIGLKNPYQIAEVKYLRDIVIPKPENTSGLFKKYIVLDNHDATPVNYPTFVLRLDGKDKAALSAIVSYINHKDCPPKLSTDLFALIHDVIKENGK